MASSGTSSTPHRGFAGNMFRYLGRKAANCFWNEKQQISTIMKDLIDTAKEVVVQAIASQDEIGTKEHQFLTKYYYMLTVCFWAFAMANAVGFWLSPLLPLLLSKFETLLVAIFLPFVVSYFCQQRFLNTTCGRRLAAFSTACVYGLILGYELRKLQLQFYVPPISFFTTTAAATSQFLAPRKRLIYFFIVGLVAGLTHVIYGCLLNGFTIGYFFWTLVISGFLTFDLQIKLKLLRATPGLFTHLRAAIFTISTYALVYGILYIVMSSARMKAAAIANNKGRRYHQDNDRT